MHTVGGAIWFARVVIDGLHIKTAVTKIFPKESPAKIKVLVNAKCAEPIVASIGET
jgi:hypothetical protein